ncbi:MAG: SDR family oxidoreductase [Candidatus Thermoplasmatota archaeon]|nr:SDR family oxidoreductase [Candidatus Thermoplasmatota archaeon]MDP7265678.1 SDR family oxidoreductase [Candidatus Thermoplasmatota archaeon]
MKRILITGAGNLGLALHDHFIDLETYEPILVAKHSPASCKINSITGDITRPESMAEVFQELKPNVIIHTAALTDVDLCEKEPNIAHLVNVEGTRNLVRLCEGDAIPLIYISTDYIFDGMKGNYRENDSPNPLNTYGRTKLEGEQIIKEMKGGEWAVIRTSFLFNASSPNYDFISYVFHGLKENKKIKYDDFRLTKPTNCRCLGPPIERIISRGLRGVYHICGRDTLSPYDLARNCAVLSGFDPASIAIRKGRRSGARRPLNPSLNTEKAERELGFTHPELHACLKYYFETMTRDSLRSTKQRLY